MEKYVIHACKARMWYVEEHLLPSMLKQGIPDDEILVWCDNDNKGCLMSAIECFKHCGESDGGCWHLQDDVIIASDFAERTRGANDFVECGFCHSSFENRDGRSVSNVGMVPAKHMWSSFPCIYIPNWLAKDFAEWYYHKASYRAEYQSFIFEKKGDDSFWRDFINECHADEMVFNHVPALIDHIDWLIGGSVVNRYRGATCRAYYWVEDDLIKELEHKIRKGAHQDGVLF